MAKFASLRSTRGLEIDPLMRLLRYSNGYLSVEDGILLFEESLSVSARFPFLLQVRHTPGNGNRSARLCYR